MRLALVGLLITTAAAVSAGETASKEAGVPILFIDHSCGGQLLAPAGPQVPVAGLPTSQCIYTSHPNGGGLRDLLSQSGYEVHEASYGSLVGQDTDIHDWHAKFRDQMERILRTRQQDELLPDGRTNRIVAFKSCFPNNDFKSAGTEPGDPDATELTVANAKAAYRSLLPYFAEQPEVLFIAMTAPPLVKPQPRGLSQKVKGWFSGSGPDASLARQFNAWLSDSQNGWLADYEGHNVQVFDYYNILTDGNESGWSAYPTKDGRNSHPSSEGNTQAAKAFISFLKEALATAGNR